MDDNRRHVKVGPATLLGLPTTYVALLFAAPIFVFFIYSFWQLEGFTIVREWTLSNYVQVIENEVYLLLIARSAAIAFVTALVTVLVSYPVAYAMAFRMEGEREFILMLMLLSLFSSYLVRVYAWKTILGATGVLNSILMLSGLVQEPVAWLMYSRFAVGITLMSVFVPMALLPIYSALMNIPHTLLEASRDLGAGPVGTFLRVTLPLSMPGMLAGFVFTFVLTAGDYVTPALLGGRDGQMIGNAIVSQFGVASNWPLGSAITFTVIGVFTVIFAAGAFVFHKLGLRG